MNSPLPESPSASAKPAARPKRTRTMLLVGAAMAGAAIGGAGIAGAATTSSTSSSTSAPASTGASSPAPNSASAPDPATMSHGPGETLLTGTTAEQVKAAALAAVPNSTVIRVETDSAGSPYEAHLTKSDGTQVTVKIDASFKVTSTESGFGGGPGGHAPNGSGAPNGSEAPPGVAG